MSKLSVRKLLIFTIMLGVSKFAYAAGGATKAAASKYFSLSPPMVVNITDNGKVRHLQVSIQLRLDDPADGQAVQEHKPAIQHELVMFLSGREAKDVRTVQGKEALRTEATEIIKKFLSENLGKPTISSVYFTAFVIQ